MPRPSQANFTALEKRQLWARDEGQCQIADCQEQERFIHSKAEVEFHHIIAVGKGGDPHDLKNGIVLHKSCHQKRYEELHPGFSRTRAIMSGQAWNHFRHRQKQIAEQAAAAPATIADLQQKARKTVPVNVR